MIDGQDCFREYMKNTLYKTELCEKQDLKTFDKAYTQCVDDISPIGDYKKF